MASGAVRLLLAAGVFALPGLATDTALPHELFEQIAEGSRGAWRTFGGPTEAVISSGGFVLRSGDQARRFRWSDSMGLEQLTADQLLDSASYELADAEGHSRRLLHAQRIRASNSDGTIAVTYYFGGRGFEFDIEATPGATVPEFWIDSLDADLAVDAAGAVELDGNRLALRPVAYSVDAVGDRHPVMAEYRLDGSRRLRLVVASYDPTEKLVVDPVVTYASYFGGPGGQDPSAIRELADGSVLLAGFTRTYDLPQAVSLSGLSMDPVETGTGSRCFLAIVSPTEKRIRSVSYLGGGEFTRCDFVDLDSTGKILVGGTTISLSSLGSANAQFRTAKYFPESFLARVSADGKTLEYSTYLRVDGGLYAMRAGPGQKVYLGLGCRGVIDCGDAQISGYRDSFAYGLVARYDIATKRYDAQTYWPNSSIRGIELAPGGSVYIYGAVNPGAAIPLVNPVQGSSNDPTWESGGYVAAFSADLKRLEFSTYLSGGRGGDVAAVSAKPDGTIWIAGNAPPGALKNVEPLEPLEPFNPSPYAVLVKPGEATWRKAFWLGGTHGGFVGGNLTVTGSLFLADGRFCLLLNGGGPADFEPGGAAISPPSYGPKLGCLDDAAKRFTQLTPVGEEYSVDGPFISPSRAGGVWAVELQRNHYPRRGDTVPYEFKPKSLYPVTPFVDPPVDNLVFRHIDMATPTPALAGPRPVSLLALRGYNFEQLRLSGNNFSLGMQLDFDGQRIPLQVLSSFEAQLDYRTPSWGYLAPLVLDLKPGRFEGRLVVPTQPSALFSEPFLVEVGRMPPIARPFWLTTEPRIIYIKEPVYPDSEIRWNGQLLQFIENPSGPGAFATVPAELLRTGSAQAMLRNASPGGGVQRQNFRVEGTTIFNAAPPPLPILGIPGNDFVLDRSAKVIYTASEGPSGKWKVASYSVLDGSRTGETLIDQGQAQAAIDIEISSDGKYLYVLDDRLLVTRLRTDPLRKDLEIQVPPDWLTEPRTEDFSWRLKALRGTAESFVVSSLGGRLIIYDGSRPRPYTTSEFPSQVVENMEPILATSQYIYARHRPREPGEDRNPCVTRYAIDSLGFTLPEDFCDLDSDWGSYPEMKRLGGSLVLQEGDEVVPVARGPRGLSIDLPTNLGISPRLYRTAIGFEEDTYRLDVMELGSPSPIGRFPGVGELGIPSLTRVVGDEALIYVQDKLDPNTLMYRRSVQLAPHWRSLTEWYDAPSSPGLRESRRYEGSFRGSRGRNAAPGRRSAR